MRRPSTRRQFLASTAIAALASTAGCLSGESPTEEATETPTPELTPPESLDEWLTDANGYSGEPRRYGVGQEPTVAVGESTDDGIAFSPPVVEITPMTAVTWDWTGHGDQHNVVALDGTFDSGRTNAQPGTAYRYFFEDTGEHPFVCEPHRDDGMRGAVIVSEPPSTGYERVDEWLASVGNFDGTVTDRTGVSSASVSVGTEANGGDFGFGPPVLKVSPGTAVTWTWTGNGGAHNVVFENTGIDSGSPAADPSTTFRHTFEDAGQYLYACAPHQSLGMRGAVIVE